MEPELTPTHLGELFRKAREVRQITLEKAARDTRIRLRYLEAIEGDDASALPDPVSARGLVRAYAAYLGVNQVEALELLYKVERREETVGLRTVVDPSRVPSRGTGRAMATVSVFLVLGCLVGLAGFIALPALQAVAVRAEVRPTTVPTAPPTLTSAPAAAGVPTVPPGSPTPLPTATTPPTATPAPTLTPNAQQRATATAAAAMRGVTIEARSSGRVWAQAEADGQVVFSGFLLPAEKRIWKAERRILLHVGNGGLVDVTHNGQSLGPMGPSGEVVKMEWVSTR